MLVNNKRDRSNKNVKWKKLDEVVLGNAKLRFCPDQLQNLNYIFNKKLERDTDKSFEKSLRLAKSVTERLVQRLACGAGMIDVRFSSKYLICNGSMQNEDLSHNLSYTLRLDGLSTPTLYESDPTPKYGVIETDRDCPVGYSRIRLQSSTLKSWKEYTNSGGYLRRDKVQARLVELLAMAATQETPNSLLQVDESTYCGIPGKVVDSCTLRYILDVPSKQHVYNGPGGNVPRFPDTRDFRLAIVDEPNGIKMRVEFLSPALSDIALTVRILVAVGVDAWPSTSDFPSRIPLGHPDCLLYYKSAQTGLYLVGYGVHSSAWQMRVPAAEYTLLNHYGVNSVVRTILDILYEILEDIDRSRGLRKPISYKILNRYMLFTILLEELEENSKSTFQDLIAWSPPYLSTLVLKMLDKIIGRLQSEFQPNYFFKSANLLVNPGHWCDDDFVLEANNVKGYMIRLFDESLMSNKGNREFNNLLLSQETEMVLLYKWKELIDGLLPPSGTRGRRFCFAGSKSKQHIAHTQYTNRQLEYIALLLHSMVKVKQSILQADQDLSAESAVSVEFAKENYIEDIIYILVNLMDQAKEQYFLKQSNPTLSKNKLKIKLNFTQYTSKLVNQIRKDKELQAFQPEDDLSMVKIILKLLYRAMDHNKKCLGPIMRPYLNNIFTTSHSLSCHLEQIKERLRNDEIEAMGLFSELVNHAKITPAQGLIDSVNKEWTWAKNMLSMVEKNTLRLVFVADRGKVYRHILSLPSYTKTEGEEITDKGNKTRHVIRRSTLPARTYFNSLLNGSNKYRNSEVPQHEILKSASPMSLIFSKKHRRGQHRGSGDILRSMASMHKLNVFQEAASNLPQEDRSELQEMIQMFHQSKLKKSLNKKWSQTLPHLSSGGRVRPQGEAVQRYTPKEESAGIRADSEDGQAFEMTKVKAGSLLGTCRAARLREDSSVFLLEDSFKVKALLNKSESFKY
ncbi:uncharacterized protein LOC132700218 isoform X2 [Cylas formicarius]|uniref:uncharacterized protein LOC132700218 isoform X2 n=1 Tax=Cylas formicarius TaxID=197179 RepID=UPI0029588FD1|nr:uncharacterized protein LOC132700218 isoform X2 [Cylas formicarius]